MWSSDWHSSLVAYFNFLLFSDTVELKRKSVAVYFIKRPARDACLCMGELQAPAAPPAPHFVFLITL